MSQDAFRILGFPPGKYRLDYFGGMYPHVGTPSEYQIQVGFSPIIDTTISPLSPNAVDRSQQKVLPVPVGEMPRLVIGSIWEDGLEAPFGTEPAQDTFEIDTTQILDFDPSDKYTDPFNREGPLLPEDSFLFSSRLAQTGKHYVILTGEVGDYDAHGGIIIPCMELLRFYLCPGTPFARALFNGGWESELIYEPNTFEFDGDSLAVGYQPVRGLNRTTIYHLARYLKSKQMRQEVEGVHRAMRVSSGNKKPLLLYTSFPFQGTTKLTVSYLDIPYEFADEHGTRHTKTRKLVSRIHHCTHPFPISRDKVFANPQWNPASGADPDEEEQSEEESRARTISPKRPPSGHDHVDTRSGEPNTSVETSRLDLVEQRFAALEGFKAKPLPREGVVKRRKVAELQPPRPSEGLSTAAGHKGRGNADPFDIGPEENLPLRPPVELEHFVAAITVLANMPRANIKVRPVEGDLSEGMPVHLCRIRPLKELAQNDRKLVTSRGRWLKLGESTRHLAVATLIRDGKFLYVLDLQRRISLGEQGPEDVDKYAVFGCRNEDGSALTSDQVRAIAQAVVMKRGWPRENDRGIAQGLRDDLAGLRFETTQHARSRKDKDLAERIRTGIVEVLFP